MRTIPIWLASLGTLCIACAAMADSGATSDNAKPVSAPIASIASNAGGNPANGERYILVLRPGRGADPDLVVLGGKVESKMLDRLVVTIPHEKVDALKQHPRVKYLQLSLPAGVSVPSAPGTSALNAPAPAATSAGTGTTSDSLKRRIESQSLGTGSWTTGTYAYDGAGNVKAIGANSDGRNNTFVYDPVSRLTSGSANYAAPNASQAYEYDVYGNMTKVTTTPLGGAASERNFVIQASTNHINDGVVLYDIAGNVTRDSANSYTYDSFNSVTLKTGNVQESYLYTADDQRIAVGNGAGWTFSFRGPDGLVLRQYYYPLYDLTYAGSADWSWTEDFVYREGQMLGGERPLGEGGRRHYHLDHLGTPRLMTAQSAALMARHDYLPFGEEVTPLRAELDAGYDRIDPMHFTGHERDFGNTIGATADYIDYMHARYYNANAGRFLSADPELDSHRNSKNPGKWNRYTYVLNNPLLLLDASGRQEAAGFALDRDVKALSAHKITEKEYWERINARGIGATIGGGIVVGGAIAYSAITSLLGYLGVEHAAGGAVLLGETMPRVRQALTQVPGVEPFEPETAGKMLDEAELMAQNTSWLQNVIAKGIKIYDIGRDAARWNNGSIFYTREMEMLIDAGWQRSRAGYVMINGEVTTLWQWIAPQ